MAASDHAITFRVDHSDPTKVKNTWADWHIVPATRPLFLPPVPKYQFIDVPGADADLDFTEILEIGTTYNAREGSNEFIVMNGYGRWETRYSEIMNYLHGQRMKIMLDDDPAYYYIGRVGVNEWRSEKDWSRIVLDYHLDPYKYERTSSTEDWLWDALNFETGVIRDYRNIAVSGDTELTIPGTAKRVIPTFTVSSDSRVNTVADTSETEITGYAEWTRFATTENPSGLRQGWYDQNNGDYSLGSASGNVLDWRTLGDSNCPSGFTIGMYDFNSGWPIVIIDPNSDYSYIRSWDVYQFPSNVTRFTVTPPTGYRVWVTMYSSAGQDYADHYEGLAGGDGSGVTLTVNSGWAYGFTFGYFSGDASTKAADNSFLSTFVLAMTTSSSSSRNAFNAICTAQTMTMNDCYSFTVTPPNGYIAWITEYDSGGVWLATHRYTGSLTGVPVTVIVSNGNKYGVSFYGFDENGRSMAAEYAAASGDGAWITYDWSNIVDGESGDLPDMYPGGIRQGYFDPTTGAATYTSVAIQYSKTVFLKQFDAYSELQLIPASGTLAWITEYDSSQTFLRQYGYDFSIPIGGSPGTTAKAVTAPVTPGHYYGFSMGPYASGVRIFANLLIKVNPEFGKDFMKSFTLGLGEVNKTDQNKPILTAVNADNDLIVEMLAVRCWNGKYDLGADRKVNIEALGYNYDEVQAKVDEMSVYFSPSRYLDYDFYDLNTRLHNAGIDLDVTVPDAWLYCDVPLPSSGSTPTQTPTTKDAVYDWSKLGTPTYPSGFRVGLYNINTGAEQPGGYGNYIMSASKASFPGYETLKITPPSEYGVWVSVFNASGQYVRKYGTNSSPGVSVTVPLTDNYSYGFTFYGFTSGDYSNAGNTELLKRFVGNLSAPVTTIQRKGLNVTVDNNVYFLPSGITKNPNIVIGNEETTLKFSGTTGSVSVEYRGGSL